MKKTFLYILLVGALSACGGSTTDQQETTPSEPAGEPPKSDAAPTADYSSLLQNYRCDMDAAEVANALGVSESSIGIPDYAKQPSFAETGKCFFTVQGFGKDADGGDTQINWGSEDGMSLADVRGEIESYSKNMKEMPESVRNITGIDLQMADTDDSYLAYQNKTGRIIILNENHGAMLLTYGTAGRGASRTEEQQEALKEKMTQLANYLLEKHGA